MRTRRSASSSSDPVSSSPTNSRLEKRVSSRAAHRPTVAKHEHGHVPVLLHEVLASLAIKPNDVVLDATLGGAGHARAIIEHLGARGTFIGLDADGQAIERTRTALSAARARVFLKPANFRDSRKVLEELGVEKIDKALFDLGWSGYQLSAGRGFSFLKDEPLLMTYADSPAPDALTAERIVNTWREESLTDVINGWGDERFARKIAKAIVERRKQKPIRTSEDLADIISKTVRRSGRVHPATRTFQALRIAVNDELGALKEGLRAAWDALSSGGRLAVISFHSIEDREVKHLMREWEKEGAGEWLTKSPVQASREELRVNPRARSAKLRVIQKN